MTDETWDGVIETAGPNPLLRLAGGLAALGLIVLIASTGWQRLSAIGVLGASLMQTALLAGTLYFTWFRGAPVWKLLVTTGVMFVLVMVINLNTAKTGIEALRADVATLSDLSFDTHGNLIVPPDAEQRGPLSRITIRMVGDVDALIRDYHQQVEYAGAFALFDADRLRVNSNVLRNCGAVTAMKAEIPAYKKRHLAIIGQARRELAGVDVPPAIKKAFLAGMDESLSQTQSEVEKLWSLNGRQIDEAAGVCTILAQRNWQGWGSSFAFTSRPDMEAFNRHNSRLRAIAVELDTLTAGNKERMARYQQDLRRFLN
jgi:hypothetical protein